MSTPATASAVNNAGFAFVVNSLLHSNKNAKLLSKAKKESDTKVEVNNNNNNVPEFVDAHGAVKETSDNAKETESPTTSSKKKRVKLSKYTRTQLESIGRTKPKPEDRQREKRLTLVATKGVVQLFNVVKEQQKQIKDKLEEAGSGGTKRAKAMSEFNEEKLFKKINSQKDGQKNNQQEKKKWSVLSDDFMTGGKFKDWDKESDSD